MKLNELLLEINARGRIPDINGYFIDVLGKFHTIKDFSDIGRDRIQHLLNIGWIRILIPREVAGMYRSEYRVIIDLPNKPARKALSQLHDWLKNESFVYDDYVIRRGGKGRSLSKHDVVNHIRNVMMYESKITESNIPPTPYGYWITPEGKFIVVNDVQGETHQDIILSYFPRQPLTNPRGEQGVAMDSGWIRTINYYRTTTLYMSYTNPSKRAISSLYQMIRAESDRFTQYIFEVDSPVILDDMREALRYVNNLKMEALKEANIPSSNYGYLIKADGKFIPINDIALDEDEFSHGAVIIKLLGLDGSVVSWTEANRIVMKKGWIRTVNDHRMSVLYIGLIIPSRKALSSLTSMIRSDVEYNEYRFESPPARFGTKREALRYVNKLKMEAVF